MPTLSRTTAYAAIAAALLVPSTGHTGVHGDDLARCLVERTSVEDRILLAKWVFSVIAAHPSTASLATIDATQKATVAESTGRLFETLLITACHDETAKAVEYEGAEAIGSSFKTLGEIAMTTLMSNPKVQAESQNFMQYVDLEKFDQAFSPKTGD